MSHRSRADRLRPRTRGHSVAGVVLTLFAVLGCPGSSPPGPREGLHDAEAPGRIAVAPGVAVSATGGGLAVARSLLAIDTRVAPLAISSVHHAPGGGWRWSFELELRDGTFTDATGAAHDVTALADGAVVPGTDWVKLDAARMKTRGGLVHAFDGTGRLAAVHWSSDPYPRLRHVTGLVGAGLARTVAIEQCTAPDACTPVYDLTWSAEGRLVAVEDRAGRRAELDWDAAGRLVAARDVGDVADGWPGERYGWSGDTLVSRETSDGERTTFHWAGGRVAAVVAEGPGTPTHTFAYQRLGSDDNRTTHVDPAGATTVFAWDDARRVLRRTLADLGETTSFDWDGPRIARIESPDGVVVERAWQAGWLVSETLPGGNVRTYAWNPEGTNRLDPAAGAPFEIVDALGTLLAVSYDAAGRPVALTDGAGDVRRFTWDGVELVSLETPSGAVQIYEGYGEHGFPTILRQGEEILDERVYDAVGNLLRGRDLADPTATSTAGVVERTFDADRNVATLVVADESGGYGVVVERTIRVHRRADGRPLRIERPYGGDTEHVYDALGRRVARRERVDGAWQTTTFAWDAAGRVVAEEKPNGMRREWTYDAAGRPTTLTALRDGAVESVLGSTWLAGRLVATHDSVRDASETFAYDAAGRVERVVHARGEATELVWDARGRATEVTLRLPDGSVLRTLGVAYDGADREVSIRDGGPGGPELLGRAWAGGRLVETRYGNGLTRTYAYGEGTDLWAGSTTTAADGSWVADLTIGGSVSEASAVLAYETRTADPHGLVADPPPDSEPGQVATVEGYWLDSGSEGRPQGLRLRFTFNGLPVGTTDYDALGNRLSMGQNDYDGSYESRSFAYNEEHNRLLEVYRPADWHTEKVVERTYAYDGAGFVTHVDGVPVEWNAQGRVTRVGDLAHFTWDAAGRPISRTVLGEETVHWFGGRLEAPAGELPRYLDLGEVRLDLAQDEHRYRHLDPRRNVKFVTDAAGDVVAHHWYTAYGRWASYGPDDDDRGFAGGTHAAGFVVLGARILDPLAGRFLSPDPVETWMDPYAYTWGNPVELWDPSGLQGQPVPAGPPVAATVADIIGLGILAVATVLALPAPVVLVGAPLVIIGYGLLAISIGLRDDAERRRDGVSPSDTVPPVPPVPLGEVSEDFICNDDGCFSLNSGGSSQIGGGGGGGGIDIGVASCSTPGSTCAAGPGLCWMLVWLHGRRRRSRLNIA